VTLATGQSLQVHRTLATRLSAYVALTKPRIIELLLVTTFPAMVLAAGRVPSTGLVVATLVAGALAAGSANALNCYLDRDIDAVMTRTSRRPLTAGEVSPAHALVFGLVLGVVATASMWAATNALAAILTVAAIVFYVVGYTLVLKRRTPQNIVWGGAAGCMPVLIGWAAVTGSLAWTPVVLFAVVFFWTPPHFWALALRFRTDYAAAGVPMLPVVASDRIVARQIQVYSWVMVAASLALWPVARLNLGYGVCALALGGVFLLEAHRLGSRVRAGSDPLPMRLFHWSITYLSLLSMVIVLDVLVRPWT
jgi:heme o synthase